MTTSLTTSSLLQISNNCYRSQPISPLVYTTMCRPTNSRELLSFVLAVYGGFLIGYSNAREPPRVSPSYPRRHFAQAGEVVRLVCPVDPDPLTGLLVTWQHEGESIHAGWKRYRIQEEGRVLRIVDVEIEDGGTFVCKAANGFGSVDAKHYLYIYGPNESRPLPAYKDEDEPASLNTHAGAVEEKWKAQAEIVPPFPGNVTVSVGEQAVFICHAKGDGEPRIQWLRQEYIDDVTDDAEPRSRFRRLAANDVQRHRYKIVDGSLTISLRDGTYLNKLTLRSVAEQDSGLYICSTMNGRGFGYKSAYLNVLPAAAKSTKNSFHDNQFAVDSTFVPVVIATVIVIGSILIFGTAIVICRSHFRRKSSPSSPTVPESPARSREQAKSGGGAVSTSSSSRTPTSFRCTQERGCNRYQLPYRYAVGRNFVGHVPNIPHPPHIILAKENDRFHSLCPISDTSSECSTLFKPTPAPAATPVPPSELDFHLLHGYVDDRFPRRQYLDDC